MEFETTTHISSAVLAEEINELYEGSDWRTELLLNIESSEESLNTSQKRSRNSKAKRDVFNAKWVNRKEKNRLHNLAIAQGFIKTSNGKTFFREGKGQPRRK
jgi:hypothetical protein